MARMVIYGHHYIKKLLSAVFCMTNFWEAGTFFLHRIAMQKQTGPQYIGRVRFLKRGSTLDGRNSALKTPYPLLPYIF